METLRHRISNFIESLDSQSLQIDDQCVLLPAGAGASTYALSNGGSCTNNIPACQGSTNEKACHNNNGFCGDTHNKGKCVNKGIVDKPIVNVCNYASC